MVLEPICCPSCNSTNVVKNGKSDEGKQRYRCRKAECSRSSFIREYSYRGYLPNVKQQIADMAVNGSGIRDTARVLKISPTTVIETLKKRSFSRASQHNTAATDAELAYFSDGRESCRS
jgi:transposase-like protein